MKRIEELDSTDGETLVSFKAVRYHIDSTMLLAHGLHQQVTIIAAKVVKEYLNLNGIN